MIRIPTLFLLIALFSSAVAQDIQYKTISDIPYYAEEVRRQDSYIGERCLLDIYYPVNKKDFTTVVWFHGGGLTGGNKELPEALKNKDLCIVGINYRLAPGVKAPAYIEDAAAAVAWVFKNIGRYGGDSSRIFVSGHSAGGYLSMMIGLDKQYLAVHGIDADSIAGLIPFSGQAITHFTIRKENDIDDKQPVIDKYAPLFHVRSDAPPMLLITGDRELEMLGRYEENAYLARMMKVAGHQDTRLLELQGYGHDMAYPAFPLMLNEITRLNREKK
ncbi:Acetyl esterase/lipase [Porphyromonadaceae bacterium NLAE-zl-C104]|jgi:acetyl esterase/lipase|uniref:alpha/beta hydrolase n=1 Tax=Proteiniphilum saccharofermentans TaxID=1642647 RepID=UPI00089D8493|nr:alpha/beta hydrolase [Proteiniphilum saccharofermentans]SEA04591.1 Acetyl esterase/lipase [Porphyromonadaceae bacterium KH3R12]SFS45169.1 Acetyl esterase/lipase [Porphyromonadaceae bacterium NLAE-zl-C104]